MAHSKSLSLWISDLTKAPRRISKEKKKGGKKEERKKSEKFSPPANEVGFLHEHPRVDLAELEACLRNITYALCPLSFHCDTISQIGHLSVSGKH